MKNSGEFQNSMRAVTINSEFRLPGLTRLVVQSLLICVHKPTSVVARLGPPPFHNSQTLSVYQESSQLASSPGPSQLFNVAR